MAQRNRYNRGNGNSNNSNNSNNQYRRALSGGGGGSAWARSSQGARANAQAMRGGSRTMTDAKQFMLKKGDALDEKFGFHLLPTLLEQEDQDALAAAAADDMSSIGRASTTTTSDREPRLGWLLNLRATSILEPTEGKFEVSALELYFLQQDGHAFKTRVIFQPYLYVRPAPNRAHEVVGYCQRKFDGLVAKAERVHLEDLDLPNHLSGKLAVYVKLSFYTVGDLVSVKQALAPIVERNQRQQQTRDAYALGGQTSTGTTADSVDFDADDTHIGPMSRSGLDESESALLELREYDVPYSMRVAIDLDIRVGAWYHVAYDPLAPYVPSSVTRLVDMVDKAEPVVCAFDIETTKLPLKFPDATFDQIYMISYMLDRQGYLIVNREFVGADIPDFEYTPKPEYEGPFTVFNEPNEAAVLRRFFDHVAEAKPHIYVTYNGDFFDWPFIDARAKVHGLSLADELGVSLDVRSGEYRGRAAVHMDAYCWVKRDSYLPQGSQGLKAVTKYKLGYDPVEVDAEDMLALARDQPLHMASYSVSDAVATFYLYDKYVHLFVFSLCTIIPLGAEDVLRKGSGTLCEALLMVEAFQGSIICPNKQASSTTETFYKGHVVENETYVGGHVECLESGVFRADFDYDFALVPSAFTQLINSIDRDLRFAIEVEMELALDSVVNYADVKSTIVSQLEALRDKPTRREKPLIYHLDVAAMYPNIILTNRLQPCAIVNEADCAACVFNTECGKTAVDDADKSCQRDMDWVWRGDFYPATRPEYFAIKTQLEYENFPVGGPQSGSSSSTTGLGFGNTGRTGMKTSTNSVKTVPFGQLPADRQELLLKQRIKSYCSSVYKKTKVTEQQTRSATVCMRENPFYVNTVRAFRDRRYDYKALTKTWKRKQAAAEAAHDVLAVVDAQTKCLVYDSLQLAHKCILNSFYGYVMRKGARWHSMEMAGIVTNTGSSIITGARQLVEQIGRPLELDTDGIWAILPKSFPETFAFELRDGSKRTISYPCVMLNADVQSKFTNPQYHERVGTTGMYQTRSECSILFEVDGPYKAMVLPASTEEGRLLKKRYAVFNFDHSLAELKGFELKRRGELQLIKAFQSQVFDCFLDGSTLTECYESVAACANRWLDVLDTRGRAMDDTELLELLTENKSMSGTLDEYAGQKSTSITTAKRLSEFLGESMVKDRGLTCKMIIAARPYGEKVTERAIPTAIFAAEDAVKRHFLKKWLRDPNVQDFDLRALLDWDYYRGRFASTVQKIISLPAAFQNVANPVPRIPLPDWMRKQVRDKHARHQQGALTQFFAPTAKLASDSGDYIADLIDMEDLAGTGGGSKSRSSVVSAKRKRATADEGDAVEADAAEAGAGSPTESTATELVALTERVTLGDAPFPDWLRSRKATWKLLLSKRKQQRLRSIHQSTGSTSTTNHLELGSHALGSSTTNPAKRHQLQRTGVTGIGMENFVLDTASALDREHWQVVEVTHEPAGHFTLWVVTTESQLLQRVTLKLPRTFFLACADAASSVNVLAALPLGARRVLRVVPHASAKPQSVIEVTVSEQQFQQHHKELLQILHDPAVRGVYELQVAALTRAVCSLGCVVKVARASSSLSSSTEYALEDLQFMSTAQVPYLVTAAHDATPMLRRVLLYYAQQHKRAIVGLIVLSDRESDGSTSTEDGYKSIATDGDATVWYVDPVSTTRARSAELQQVFDETVAAARAAGDEPALGSCSFATHVVKTVTDAFAGVNAALARLARAGAATKPTIVVAQTCVASTRRLRDRIRGLHAFPITVLPWHDEDALFPALTWRKLVGAKLVSRSLEMAADFTDVLDCARYAHLPVGNFTGDHAIAVLDTLYSRLLAKHKHLWWHSPSSVPDLGGAEHEQYQDLFSNSLLIGKTGSVGHRSSIAIHRTDTSAVVCAKGSYPTVCVELELDGLAVNAILVALQLQSLEGIGGGGGQQMEIDFETDERTTSGGPSSTSTSTGTSGTATTEAEDPCHEAFRLLRVLVTTLFKDFLATRNKFADHLLQQLYRWLSSPSALSYDPALQALVKRLMEKLFLQLLAELRRLGSQIVYADLSKIVLCTAKHDVRNAATYVAFILETVLSNELFQVLSLRPKKYFSHLLFLDAENYGGILLQTIADDTDTDNGANDPDDVTNGNSDNQQQELAIVSHWNIANYLPKGIDEYFLILVGQFIRRRAEFALKAKAKGATPTTLLTVSSTLADHAAVDNDDETEDQHQSPLATYSRRLVATYFSDKLLRIVPEIQSYNMDSSSFPVFAGSHLVLQHPALELVKFVSAIFALEPSVDAAVRKMKRTLLKLLHVSEFSDDAQFVNPSLSFAVHDVICLCCNLCRSVDLCRDPQLFQGTSVGGTKDLDTDDTEGSNDSDSDSPWHCPRCFALYDKRAFERRLVELVEAQSVQYQLQDLYCTKCKLPAEHTMRDYCACAGTFDVLAGARDELRETLRILGRIAVEHDFAWLRETVERLELA